MSITKTKIISALETRSKNIEITEVSTASSNELQDINENTKTSTNLTYPSVFCMILTVKEYLTNRV